MAAAINEGKDLHRILAARVKSINEIDVTDEDRNRAKGINFGKPGGMGDKTLKGYVKTTFGVDLSEDEVRVLSTTFDTTLPCRYSSSSTTTATSDWRSRRCLV